MFLCSSPSTPSEESCSILSALLLISQTDVLDQSLKTDQFSSQKTLSEKIFVEKTKPWNKIELLSPFGWELCLAGDPKGMNTVAYHVLKKQTDDRAPQ